jgi:hypothetical protein
MRIVCSSCALLLAGAGFPSSCPEEAPMQLVATPGDGQSEQQGACHMCCVSQCSLTGHPPSRHSCVSQARMCPSSSGPTTTSGGACCTALEGAAVPAHAGQKAASNMSRCACSLFDPAQSHPVATWLLSEANTRWTVHVCCLTRTHLQGLCGGPQPGQEGLSPWERKLGVAELPRQPQMCLHMM